MADWREADVFDDAATVVVVVTDERGRVRYWNRGAELLFGRAADEVMGLDLVDLATGVNERPWLEAIAAEVWASGSWSGRVDCRRHDGERVSARVQLRRLHDADGRASGIAVTGFDSTEPLRGQRMLAAETERLRTVAESMDEGLCVFDDAGRLQYLNPAGEHLLGYSCAEVAGREAHELIHPRDEQGRPHDFHECPMGRCRSTGRLERVDDDAFVGADGAAVRVSFTAKPFNTETGGLGSVVVFSDIGAQPPGGSERGHARHWLRATEEALADDRLELDAQPIVDLRTGAVTQHELLLRMRTREGGRLLPGAFLGVVEANDLMHDVDRWVMRQAIALAAEGERVEFNLSARSMSSCGVLADFATELTRAGADPSLLVVELTETALLGDESAAQRFTAMVRELGCELALDDFGTGYGGFTYLKRLPVDYLKIDREFVSDLATNPASRHVVRAVVRLARDFGQRTVAEGVEDLRTLDLLRELGVDMAQGFAIARPAPLPTGIRPAAPAPALAQVAASA